MPEAAKPIDNSVVEEVVTRFRGRAMKIRSEAAERIAQEHKRGIKYRRAYGLDFISWLQSRLRWLFVVTAIGYGLYRCAG